MIKCLELTGIVANETSCPPIICNTDDGVYYIKYLENVNRNKVLINEYICYQLAEIFDLPIPIYNLVSMDSFIGMKFEVYSHKFDFKCPVAFGSKKVGLGNQIIISSTEMTINDSENKKDFLKIIAFDYFVDNQDRVFNYANLLFTPSDKISWVIDFTNVFGSDTIWDEYSLKRFMDKDFYEFGFVEESIYQYMIESTKFTKANINEVRLLFQRLNSVTIKSIIDSVPVEWGLSTNDADSLYLYLIKRLSRFEEILTIIERKIV